MSLLICRTCPRYDTRASGAFSRSLGEAIRAHPSSGPTAIRHVQCLGGCPDDGVVAVDAPGKARVRFTGLDVTYAEALVEAARAHDASTTGVPGEWPVPAPLNERISSVTLKRAPWADAG